MAILGKFEVTVVIDGKDAPEYNVPEDDKLSSRPWTKAAAATVQKYIEAVEGANFTIRSTLHRGFLFQASINAMEYRLLVDGCHTLSDISEGRTSGSSNNWILEKFQFRELMTTQESVTGNLKDLKQKFDSIGTVTVEVWPFCGVKAAQQSAGHTKLLIDPVPEKALKGRAITMAAGLGDRMVGRPIVFWQGNAVGSHPVATFTFAYRTRRALEDLMIVERPRTPTPLTERDPETLTEAELRELVQRQRAELAQQAAKVKREKITSVKRERSTTPPTKDDMQIIEPVKKVRLSEIIEIEDD